jgi:hypothetical protein
LGVGAERYTGLARVTTRGQNALVSRSRSELASFLHYGFVPGVPVDFRTKPWARVRADEECGTSAVSRAELVTRGLERIRAACGEPGPGLHVVPLSGGIDSRLILALLAEAGLGERLVAASFGVPGTYDFDLAPAVARHAGVRHVALDLSQRAPTRAELLATARSAPWTNTFEAFYNQRIPEHFGSEATYWSGIMANAIAGVDLDVVTRSWAEAARVFAERCRFSRGLVLTPGDFDPVAVLPRERLLADSVLTDFEQLFAFVRYPCRLEPCLVPSGFRFRTPFREPAWVDFLLRAPKAWRAGQALYHEIAERAAPELFALPMKNRLGLRRDDAAARVWLRRARLRLARELDARFPGRRGAPNPKLNTVDFDRELRGAGGLRTLVEEALESLVARKGIDWLDLGALLRQHRERRANHGEALALLASVEFNLAAAEP